MSLVKTSRGADAVIGSGRQDRRRRFREPSTDPAGSENLSMRGVSKCENREVHGHPPVVMVGRVVRGRRGRNPVMDDRGKSDDLVVPANPSNNALGGAAEAGEGRGSPEGNATGETRAGLRAGVGVSSELDRVRQLAREDKDVRFTALLHHVTVDRLRLAYFALRPKAAPGSTT